LPATVVDVAGLGPDVEFPGDSLARLWTGSSPNARGEDVPLLAEHKGGWVRESWYPNARGGIKSLLRGRFHYIKYENGTEELYDFQNDPNESSDLIDAAEGRQTLEQFRTELRAMLDPEKA